MDDFVLNVKQIGQYPPLASVSAGTLLLGQLGVGGNYVSIDVAFLGGYFLGAQTDPNAGYVWLNPFTGVELMGLDASGGLNIFGNINVTDQIFGAGLNITRSADIGGNLFVGGPATVAGAITCSDPQGNNDAVTVNFLLGEFALETVVSFNGRQGAVQLQVEDILRAGGAPIWNPHFGGVCTAPTAWNANARDDTIATTAFVQNALCAFYDNARAIGAIVTTFNGRGGDVILNADDITIAATVPGQYAMANTPPSGDVSKRIATTAFVDDAVVLMGQQVLVEAGLISRQLDALFAPINSPQFTGIPTGPTAAQTINSGQLATTAFVHAAVTASTTGVASFNTRTGAVVLTTGDITAAGGAVLASPAFTGTPTAPTATAGTNSTQIATTAFVEAAIGAISSGVVSFNTRTGAVTLSAADVTAVGGALLASPAFSGAPTAPTAPAVTNNTQIATTAFVAAAIAALPSSVSSFNGRSGAVTFQASDISAVNGALLASPAFVGTPTAPTATAGTSNTQIATCAFVAAAVAAATSGVTSFNTRTGAVTLQAADVTGVGGALLASPTFTGTPAAPTASPGTNSGQIATTAFVTAAITATSNVASFNGRTGAVTFQASDISAVGGALLSSPNFTGTPTAPTQVPGTNNTDLATTAFVAAAIAAGGGVSSFNGRAGVVTLSTADVTGAGGATLPEVIPECGRLTLTGTSPAQSISFAPYKGAQIKINGQIRQFATLSMTSTAATINGVTGQSVAANTLYYVYAFWTGTAVALDLSTTGHATSTTAGNEGTEIKSGDDTRTLVGILRTTTAAPASNSFQDDGLGRLIRSWFNRAPTTIFNSGSNSGLTSTTGVAVTVSNFVCFANEKYFANNASYALATAQLQANCMVYLDGAQAAGVLSNVPASTTVAVTSAATSAIPTEGYHTLAAYGAVSTSQANWTATIAGMVG